MKSFYRTCAVGVGMISMFAASILNAATFRSEKVNIPFQFHVANKTLPAGEYRLQSATGSDITFLINVSTGQQVQVLRSNNQGTEGRAKLVFEVTNGAYKLKGVS